MSVQPDSPSETSTDHEVLYYYFFLLKQVCLPSVVTVFLRQAKAAHLFTTAEKFSFDDYLLESELSRAFGGIERLDMFFPFDPCLLKMSDRFIFFDLDPFI